MAKRYYLSERDRDLFQEMKRWWDRNKNPRHLLRRRAVGGGSGGGTTIRRAFCKTDAGSGSTIVCYLDTDETGEEVTVNFCVTPSSNLNKAFPYLKDGRPIIVVKIGSEWWCPGLIGKMDIC